MGLMDKAKEAAAQQLEQRRENQAANEAARQEQAVITAQHIGTLPKWEYQVKRIGEDKQKGLLGSGRMEDIFNGEGKLGWELIGVYEERAVFKRRLP